MLRCGSPLPFFCEIEALDTLGEERLWAGGVGAGKNVSPTDVESKPDNYTRQLGWEHQHAFTVLEDCRHLVGWNFLLMVAGERT